MALAEATDRRVTGHDANGFELVGQQQGGSTHARGSRCGLGARMATADDNHVIAFALTGIGQEGVSYCTHGPVIRSNVLERRNLC